MRRPSPPQNPTPETPTPPADRTDAPSLDALSADAPSAGANRSNAPTPPRRRRVFPWYWPASSRLLLAVIALAAGLDLLWNSWGASSGPAQSGPPLLVLDPNTAPPQTLEVLPQIGPKLAGRIVEARTERPFASLEDLRDRVRGIGPITLARLAPHLHIEPLSTPSTPEVVQAAKAAIPGAPPHERAGDPPGSMAANAPIR